MSIIGKYSSSITKTNIFVINCCPYLIYILLINSKGNLVENILPLAFFSAFRRTALFIFFDLRNHYSILGWIGIISAALGYFIGLFGQLSPIFWDISGILAGMGAAIFPVAANQLLRIKKYKKLDDQKAKISLQFGIFIFTLAIIALTIRKTPMISFALLLFYSIVSIINYKSIVHPQVVDKKFTFHFKNLAIMTIFLLALFLMEYGRKTGRVSVVEWGTGLLALFIAVLFSLLLGNKNKYLKKAPKKVYLQIVLYGICAQFWITYSAIFVTIVHGIKAFYWIFAAYIAGMIFSKMLVKLILNKLKFKNITISISAIIIGILLTFYFPTYFIGIFIIRAFARYQKAMALSKYEIDTNNYQSSYIVSYYLTSTAAMITLVVVWGSLILFSHLTGLATILNAINQHKLAISYLWSIDITHIIMAVFMILMALYTLFISKKNN